MIGLSDQNKRAVAAATPRNSGQPSPAGLACAQPSALRRQAPSLVWNSTSRMMGCHSLCLGVRPRSLAPSSVPGTQRDHR
jgi:hypothetical protein